MEVRLIFNRVLKLFRRNPSRISLFLGALLFLEMVLYHDIPPDPSMIRLNQKNSIFVRQIPVTTLTKSNISTTRTTTKRNLTAYLETCESIFKGDVDDIVKAETLHAKLDKYIISQHQKEFTSSLVNNCGQYSRQRGYQTSPPTQAEKEFPLAFSILTYDNPRQTERLLSAIYRPQNFYCIHVDLKAHHSVHRILRRIASCFPNVFFATRLLRVQWGSYSVLEADLNCMKDLVSKPGWKYFINLTGKEFPLKTNLELVEILKGNQGASEVHSKLFKDNHRFSHVYNATLGHMTNIPKSPAPHNITVVKGPVHVTLARPLVDYILTDNKVHDLLIWAKDTRIPDELVFSTIKYNPQVFNVSGGYVGNNGTYTFRTRYKEWKEQGIPCHGQFVRNICVFGLRDLQRLDDVPHLFLNKMNDEMQPFAFDCLEERHRHRRVNQYESDWGR